MHTCPDLFTAEDAEMNVNEMTEQIIEGAIEVNRNFKVI